MCWLYVPLLLRLVAILIIPTATTTRHIFNALYHINSGSSNARLVIMYVFDFSTHADSHSTDSGTHSFVLMMYENWLVNLVMLAFVVALLDGSAMGD